MARFARWVHESIANLWSRLVQDSSVESLVEAYASAALASACSDHWLASATCTLHPGPDGPDGPNGMATMACSPLRTSLASQAPLPPATPMMARRVVTVSPVKVSAPTFVSGAVPAPPVYGIPVITRTVRYAGWDWETKNGFGKRLDLDQMRTGELLLLSVCPKLTRLQNGYAYRL